MEKLLRHPHFASISNFRNPTAVPCPPQAAKVEDKLTMEELLSFFLTADEPCTWPPPPKTPSRPPRLRTS